MPRLHNNRNLHIENMSNVKRKKKLGNSMVNREKKNATTVTLSYQYGFICVLFGWTEDFFRTFSSSSSFFFSMPCSFFWKVSLAWLLKSIESCMKCIAIDWVIKLLQIDWMCRMCGGSQRANEQASEPARTWNCMSVYI